MKIINGIRSYINDSETKITIVNSKINIVNYKDIDHFDSNKIIISTNSESIVINGDNLVVSKLMNDEVLIAGDFNKIEFR